MSRQSIRWSAVALGLVTTMTLVIHADEAKPAGKKPKVEVVFCLDTTGSMKGLIAGAKAKIWSISNQIVSGKPTPDVKIGLVAYRDRGDEYITKVIDLTDDLDAIHGHLFKFQADGGGDEPESVNQALDDAVNKIKWSDDKDTLKLLFLVGDAPAHMDYPDDVKYPETCKKAVLKNIIINTVQCGNAESCRKQWQEICKLAEGSYVQIPQEGGVVAVATPYDRRLSEINTEMARSTLAFGSERMRQEGETKKGAAAGLAPTAGAADRAAVNAKAGRVATYDLIDSIKQKKVKLEDLKPEELPAELRKLSLKEQKDYLDKLEKRRAELNKEVLELDKKRNDYIDKENAKLKEKGKGPSAFDTKVLEILRDQAKKHMIEY
jgi:Mg-chelatase subunit ChlD